VIHPRLTPRRRLRALGVTLAVAASLAAISPPPASAGLCGVVGGFSGWAGKACSAVTHPGKIIKAGKSLATGHPAKAVKAITSSGAGKTALGLGALVVWVTGGAKSALSSTAGIIKKTTTPQLRSTWFSGMYWRMTAIAALLTLPFLFAAAGQAVVRSDLALLSRSALGYLPLSLLAVSIAAPVTMLLLTATDQLSAVVSAAAGQAGTRFLTVTGQHVATFDPVGRSEFLKFFVGLLTSGAAVLLWIELLMRDAAVYIVVLMLPLAFAAMVWPARRVWATRTAEVLVALIVAKFVMVAILALGGAALGPAGGTTGLLIGLVLVTLAAFAPWGLLRLLPLAEIASGAVGHLRAEADSGADRLLSREDQGGQAPPEWAGDAVARMHQDAEQSADGAPEIRRQPFDWEAAQGTQEQTGSGATAAAGGAETAELVGAVGTVGATAGVGHAHTTNGTHPRAENGAGRASYGVVATTEAGAATDQPSERSPGLPDIYQAEDLSLPPLVLGLEGLPTEPLHKRQAELRADRQGREAGDDQPDRSTSDQQDPTSDDADPLPGRQEPDEGVL
jgi:hypothetical protein